MGCDTGYRVSDLLNLKVQDVTRRKISIVERKTKKHKAAHLSEATNENLAHYVQAHGISGSDYIFFDNPSEKGVKPVSRQYVWRIIKQAGLAVGLPRLNLAHIPHARHMRGGY